MKTDFSINVQVNIGMTPETVRLVTAILQKTPAALAAVPAASEQPQPEKPAAEAGSKDKGNAMPETAEAETPPEAGAPADGDKELTERDIREAMHRTRQRIEGEDYRDNTDSDGYKKYHKQLTAQFKNIAALLGSDKPSLLPAGKRAPFIKQCDELVLQDGSITTICPY